MPSTASYTQLAHTDDDRDRAAHKPPHPASLDPRFVRPHPPAWKRAALVALVAFLFWLAFYIRPSGGPRPHARVVHATRYSKEFKYRPAASPVITERLEDGTIRLRGALPT